MSVQEHSLLVQRAAAAVGGEDKLCLLLGVSWSDLHGWLDGGAAVPTPVFLKLVDLLERAPEPAVRTVAHPFFAPDYTPASPVELCESALDAALFAARTDLGNVQLLDAGGALRIAAQRGFERPFLEFFDAVKGPESACGVALILGRQYAVADITTHAVFRGTEAGDVLLAAGARAVESTPIMSASGAPLGMLSVHHRCPGTPDDAVLALLARVARRAGTLLEGKPFLL
jgi:GAF domain-containing protein